MLSAVWSGVEWGRLHWLDFTVQSTGRNWWAETGPGPQSVSQSSVSPGPELSWARETWRSETVWDNMAEEDTDWSYSETIPKQTISTLSRCHSYREIVFIKPFRTFLVIWSRLLTLFLLGAEQNRTRWSEVHCKVVEWNLSKTKEHSPSKNSNWEFGKTILFKCAGLFSELKTSDSALIKVIILCSYQVFSSDIFPMLHFLSYKLCQRDEPF